ncbi:hypothetical protein COCVIDRAFT_28664 [Bipolaris victoriae FI3]|uniref:EXPERA domain-containing protein n=1 Tax=Bipolaris victoriae (strain FI3) TaxID=930091 RepID=W7EG73_BIPV3|nr:hypothetical protein COCVIDRAFT_28664 [Bipolaris victoriae FI3]
MVTTRSRPQGDFPTSEPSPTKKTPRSRNSTASPAPPDFGASPSGAASLAKRAVSNAFDKISPPAPAAIDEPTWCHTASKVTLAWLSISWPLVLWDTLYILGRPHTMAGGALQWPLWKPYETYAAIDYVYGWPGWENHDGFGAAQGVLNAIELILYGIYALTVYNHGQPAAGGTGVEVSKDKGGFFAGGIKVRGKSGNRAVLIGFTAAVMTLSKTILYYCNEYFSDFANIRHNDWFTLIFLYIIMNGLWIIFPSYMVIVFGTDIITALDYASDPSSKKRN